MTTETQTAAIRQATDESSMYQQGSGWIVSTYSPTEECMRLSHERPHREAQECLTAWRAQRAVELVTGDYQAACAAMLRTGTLRERVSATLADEATR